MCDDCPICLRQLASEPWGVCIPCGHAFHLSCWGQGRRNEKHVPSCATCNEVATEFVVSGSGHEDGGDDEAKPQQCTMVRSSDQDEEPATSTNSRASGEMGGITPRRRDAARGALRHLGFSLTAVKRHKDWLKRGKDTPKCSSDNEGRVSPPQAGSDSHDNWREREEEELRRIKADAKEHRAGEAGGRPGARQTGQDVLKEKSSSRPRLIDTAAQCFVSEMFAPEDVGERQEEAARTGSARELHAYVVCESDQISGVSSEMHESASSDLNAADEVLGVERGLVDMGFERDRIKRTLSEMRLSGSSDLDMDEVLGRMLADDLPRASNVADNSLVSSLMSMGFEEEKIRHAVSDMRLSGASDINADKVLGVMLGGDVPAKVTTTNGAGGDSSDCNAGNQADLLEGMRPSSCRDPALNHARVATDGTARESSQADFLEGMRPSSCRDPALNDASAAPQHRRPTIEIAPGQEGLLLRGRQTWAAMHNGTAILVTCLVCNETLQCCPEADYFLCPDCDVVGDCGGGRLLRSSRSSIGAIGLGYKKKNAL